MPKPWGGRMIVEAPSHSRESQNILMAMFLSPGLRKYTYPKQGLYRPHTDTVTVTRTGTRQPPSCGKGPTAVGESVMVLPGSSRVSAGQRKFPLAGWLVRAAIDTSEGRTAVVVRDDNAAHMAKGSRLGGGWHLTRRRITPCR